MIYFGKWEEKWISTIPSIIYLMDYPVDDGGEEWENWVRPQEEHLVKENFCSLKWVVNKFAK